MKINRFLDFYPKTNEIIYIILPIKLKFHFYYTVMNLIKLILYNSHKINSYTCAKNIPIL